MKRRKMVRITVKFCLVLLLLSTISLSEVRADMKLVRTVYLTPSDRAYRPEYESALETAVLGLQDWFANEMDGWTFSVPSDTVEWYQTPHTASWYQTDPANSTFQWLRFWNSSLSDGFALTGGQFNDPDNRWLFYIDADPLPGQATGGNAGVALFPANDLRGLNGDPLVPINPGDSATNPGFDRWVGGMGHELGHAWGLPHPADSPGGAHDWSLMYYGYSTFPNTYLQPHEKQALMDTGYFVPVPSAAILALLGLITANTRLRRTRIRT